MAALTLTAPLATGAIVTPITPTVSDTVAIGILGDQGLVLRVQTTGTLSNLTISDAGFTPAGNATTATAIAMAATQIRVIYLSPKRVDVNGVITITASSVTGMTYELYPA